MKTSLSIRFLDIPKTMFLQSNFLRKVNFLHGYDILFFNDSCSFPYTKRVLKVSDYFVEKIQHESTTLNPTRSLRTHGIKGTRQKIIVTHDHSELRRVKAGSRPKTRFCHIFVSLSLLNLHVAVKFCTRVERSRISWMTV